MFRLLTVMVVIIALASGGAAFLPNSAVAQPPSKPSREQIARAETLVAKATASFKKKQYAEAAQQFLEAYEISQSPGTLFNAARANQEAGLLVDARELFLLYKKKSNDRAGLLDAEKAIAKIEDALGINAVKPPPVVVIEPAEQATPTVPASIGIESDATPTATTTHRGFSIDKLNNWRSYTALGAVAAGISIMIVGRTIGVGANERVIRTSDDANEYRASFATGSTLWWTGLGIALVGGGGFGGWSVVEASR
ncbi:MAG: hypothetical protein A3C15_03235 [Candidatus Magasanikbacteria bacterium RIFCSPHIGHO2_02_FULL_50_9b]|uniref:Tetratricopeptide repeat protein n=1 Tax=Candidatus Magasanikbacteria bacterium RIFCSPHIGHO2_02_FULL_50_9b TaxID=1798682 RepID=A0A1F6M7G9_9BACT|nr:MAG: hypothetical protein A3C15_03235 [Candidatus Magasanikbacteria bacterium RIFCSPHIGHO2_02_FULL_50_9b]